MTPPTPAHTNRGPRCRLLWLVVLASAAASPAHADEDITRWARWTLYDRPWKGPTVPYPDRAPRPEGMAWNLRSVRHPITLHADRGVSAARAHAALGALENAYDVLSATGWPLPYTDGGYGGSSDFDLYLVQAAGRDADAKVELPLGWSYFDAATSFAVVDARVPERCLDSRILSATAQAGLVGQDPAEAPGWRRATGDFVAWLATGIFGCDAGAVGSAQRAARLGWFGGDVVHDGASHEGAALWLAMLSTRHDGGSGTFLRELWQFARQKSDGVQPLRASPNLWEVLERALANAEQDLERSLLEAAVARYFAGRPAARFSPYPAVRQLREDAAVPLTRLDVRQLPEHLPTEWLGPLGSAYTLVELGDDPRPQTVRGWLRADPGPRWSLTAVRLASDGGELGRVQAPLRKEPSAFVPVHTTPDTQAVLWVITRLPRAWSDPAPKHSLPRAARLILDAQGAP